MPPYSVPIVLHTLRIVRACQRLSCRCKLYWQAAVRRHDPDHCRSMQAFPASAGPQAERRAEAALFELERMLEDNRRYIMGDTFTYADIVLASVMAPWALTGKSRALFAGGRDCGTFSEAGLPPRLLDWQRRTQTAFPRVFDLILRVYSGHRLRRRSLG